MSFYFRKSVSVGPFRFNLSKGGIGVSAGIKGLRFGTGPRGHYIHAGVGGLYYRSSIPSGSKRPRPLPSQPLQSPHRTPPQNVEMLRVSSTDVLQMEDARFSDILDDLTAKQNATSMTMVLGGVSVVMALFAAFAGGVGGLVAGLIFAGAAALVGAVLDSFQRSSVLIYDLEDDAKAAYQTVTAAFDGLLASASGTLTLVGPFWTFTLGSGMRGRATCSIGVRPCSTIPCHGRLRATSDPRPSRVAR